MSSLRKIVYTDGGCLRNGTEGALAGAGVFFGERDPRNISSTVPGHQTNNRGEIYAIILALEGTDGPLEIRTDSYLSIQCAIMAWTPKKNLDLYQRVWTLLEDRDVKFVWVKGHSGEPGNEAADALAQKAMQIISP